MGQFWVVPPPQSTPKFDQNDPLTYNFQHCEFQLSTSSRSNGLI